MLAPLIFSLSLLARIRANKNLFPTIGTDIIDQSQTLKLSPSLLEVRCRETVRTVNTRNRATFATVLVFI